MRIGWAAEPLTAVGSERGQGLAGEGQQPVVELVDAGLLSRGVLEPGHRQVLVVGFGSAGDEDTAVDHHDAVVRERGVGSPLFGTQVDNDPDSCLAHGFREVLVGALADAAIDKAFLNGLTFVAPQD